MHCEGIDRENDGEADDYVNKETCTHAHTHTHIHTHAHTHTHTLPHTHAQIETNKKANKQTNKQSDSCSITHDKRPPPHLPGHCQRAPEQPRGDRTVSSKSDTDSQR